MFRKVASIAVAAAATALLWAGSANAQVRTAALETGFQAGPGPRPRAASRW